MGNHITQLSDTGIPVSRYGLWDLRDQSWLGDDRGPMIYCDKIHAAASATILTERMRTPIVPREWLDAIPVLKDEVDVEMTGEEAVKRIEGIEGIEGIEKHEN